MQICITMMLTQYIHLLYRVRVRSLSCRVSAVVRRSDTWSVVELWFPEKSQILIKIEIKTCINQLLPTCKKTVKKITLIHAVMKIFFAAIESGNAITRPYEIGPRSPPYASTNCSTLVKGLSRNLLRINERTTTPKLRFKKLSKLFKYYRFLNKIINWTIPFFAKVTDNSIDEAKQ
jgi:hypothetical protein